MADDEALLHAMTAGQRGDAEADGVEPHEIDLLGKQPARIVFAKAGGLDEREALEVGRVGLQVGTRFGEHRWEPC